MLLLSPLATAMATMSATAVGMALRGEVQGIVTAPIDKAALLRVAQSAGALA